MRSSYSHKHVFLHCKTLYKYAETQVKYQEGNVSNLQLNENMIHESMYGLNFPGKPEVCIDDAVYL